VRPSAAAFRRALFPPRRERDRFLRFALDAEGEDGFGPTGERLEVAARTAPSPWRDVTFWDPEMIDQAPAGPPC